MKNLLRIFAVLAAVAFAVSFASCSKGDEGGNGNGNGGDTKPTYTVTFDADGGAPAPAAQKVKEGDKAAAPPAVTKTGYEFLYWSLNGTLGYDFSTPVTSNITLTAHWKAAAEAEYWQVTWNLDGGA
jgi:hypothetical protein